jgi:hypothetical protein
MASPQIFTDFHRFTKKICVELCSLWTENLVNGVT